MPFFYHFNKMRRMHTAITAVALAIFLMALPARAQDAARPSPKIQTSEIPERSAGSYLDQIKASQEIKTVIPRPGVAIADLPDPEPNAPPLNNTIEGINFDENGSLNGTYFIPPDPIGVAGPDHLVAVTNCSIEWFTKAGFTEKSEALSTFFSSLTPLTKTFDPKVIYDQYSGRFVVITLEKTDVASGAASNTSRILVAVSDDSNPNGTWYFHSIASKITISATDYWADYPGLAIDDEAIYITNNLFTFGSGFFGGARLWIVHKTPYYSGGAATVTVHDPSTAVGEAATTMQPAHMFGTVPGSVGTFLVRYSGYSDGTDEYLSIIRVDHPTTAPAFSHQFVALGNIDNTAISTMPDAPQKGVADLIDTGDRRALHAVWRGNALWTTMTILPGAGPNVSQATAHWTKVNTTVLALLSLSDQGDIGGEEITPSAYTFYPSIAVDGSGNAGIGFAMSGAGIYPGAYYTARLAGNLPGAVQPINVLREGQDYYVRLFGGSRNRWGDYSGMSIDPSDDATFWVFNEYALTRGTILISYPTQDGRWCTAFGSFTFDALPSAPAREWTARYNGPAAANDAALAMATDLEGNSYVAGYSLNAGGNADYLVVKYNDAGVKQWTARYNGTGSGADTARAICLDSYGNVYVAGTSKGASGTLDGVAIKYNNAGVQQWAARFNGAASGDDGFNDIECDAAGNVSVTGYTTSLAAGKNFITIRYSTAGVKVWQAGEDGAGHGEDGAHELALDADGNVYVAGYTTNLSGNFDFTTAKYNSSGTRLWKASFNAAASGNDVATDLALDPASNVYVAGYSKNAAGNDDYLAIKYNTAGTRLWTARYNNGPAAGEDLANDVAADESGNVYVTGHSKNAGGNLDYATVKYNTAGVQQWAARYNGTGSGDDGANRVLVDGSGNVFVAGYSTGAAGADQDFVAVNYNSAGVKQWVLRLNATANGVDIANDMALDILGNLFMTGSSENAAGNTDFLTVKYSPVIPTLAFAAPASPAQIAGQTASPAPAIFILEQNYPNPFNPTAVISFQLPEDSDVALAIHNMNGQLVKKLFMGEMNAGHHSIMWDAKDDRGGRVTSGVYLYVIKAGEFTAQRKLVLMK